MREQKKELWTREHWREKAGNICYWPWTRLENLQLVVNIWNWTWTLREHLNLYVFYCVCCNAIINSIYISGKEKTKKLSSCAIYTKSSLKFSKIIDCDGFCLLNKQAVRQAKIILTWFNLTGESYLNITKVSDSDDFFSKINRPVTNCLWTNLFHMRS